jgi:hypothetical protein
METIQHMVPDGFPLAVLTQQGAEAANLVVTENSTGTQSEAASSASPYHRLSEHDAWQRISQNRAARECGHDRDDLRHGIEDRRCSRVKTPSPPRRYLVEDIAPVGKSGFRALTGPLRQVRWPDKFKTGNIDRYDGFNNPE